MQKKSKKKQLNTISENTANTTKKQTSFLFSTQKIYFNFDLSKEIFAVNQHKIIFMLSINYIIIYLNYYKKYLKTLYL